MAQTIFTKILKFLTAFENQDISQWNLDLGPLF